MAPAPARGVATSRRSRAVVAAAMALTIAFVASAASPQAAPPSRAAERPAALRLERGSIARDQVVALGRDLVVEGEALSDVVAVDGTVTIPGRIGGDVIVLGGDVRLLAGARVDGDVFVLGGDVSSASGATIAGRTVAYPSVSRAWLTLLEGPSLGLSSASPLVVGAKLALLCGWLVLLLLLFATAGREVLATSESVVADPFRNFLVGLTAVLSLVLSALFLTSLAATVLGVPLLFLAVFVGLLLKLWGMVAVFHALGEWVSRRLLRGKLLPLSAATVGLLLLGAAKLLPWIGVWTWTVATLIGVGAALSTKLGRREPWLATT
ncbi:MAG TPA: polymer-forming cytoskeletal protein [Thermoanaerobaculia bacterium]|nr:polymer-forming cytoskeletal protein [Thermoanaerobaculia bacterium]